MIQVNIHDAKTNFSRLIKKVLEGEEIIIAKGNKPVAKLIQLSTSERKRKIGSAKDKIKMASDFSELLNDFKEYIN